MSDDRLKVPIDEITRERLSRSAARNGRTTAQHAALLIRYALDVCPDDQDPYGWKVTRKAVRIMGEGDAKFGDATDEEAQK